MATESICEIQPMPEYVQEEHYGEYIGCSVGIMAYNEEANIGRTICAVLEQRGPNVRIEEIIVVASGCTDRTVPIVTEIARQEPRVRLCVQEKREGKASAINLFLKEARTQVAVLIGADVIPEAGALESMCAPFRDPKIGMVGGRPVPVNDPATFLGHAVHLLWRLHDQMARVEPKLGEVIAFRNVISGIPSDTPVDEISIQALISQLGYQLIYEPACIVYNKGPLTVRDFLKQRRRIYAGHLQVREQQNYAASTMQVKPIIRQILVSYTFALCAPRQILWTLGTILLEGLARLQGYLDYRMKRQHHIWQMVESTKNLDMGTYKVRRICNAVSVIIFRFIVEDVENQDAINHESEDREATEVVRKLLPVLRSKLRKEDRLSISGPGILTAVIRAEQHGAELVSRRIQETVQATSVRLGLRGRRVNVTVVSSSLTFTLVEKSKKMAVSSSVVQTALMATQATNGKADLS
jgi:poly-beta-1,6-N-acetyl-D-glucosamine synthase